MPLTTLSLSLRLEWMNHPKIQLSFSNGLVVVNKQRGQKRAIEIGH
jgi:hypothetical protein